MILELNLEEKNGVIECDQGPLAYIQRFQTVEVGWRHSSQSMLPRADDPDDDDHCLNISLVFIQVP